MTALSSDNWLAIFMVALFVVTAWLLISRRWEKDGPPECYGSAPGPQQRAENDCDECPWADRCLLWRPMQTAPRDGTEFWALTDDVQNMDLPPFVSKCSWHPDAGFCTDELREPIAWRPL